MARTKAVKTKAKKSTATKAMKSTKAMKATKAARAPDLKPGEKEEWHYENTRNVTATWTRIVYKGAVNSVLCYKAHN